MRRWTIAVVSITVLSLAACTRTVVEGGGTTSATPVSLGGLTAETVGDPIVRLVERVRPAVVNVTTDTMSLDPYSQGSGQGVGTGFVVRSDGIIVTNYHVVEAAQRITVITPGPDSERYQARVIGGDEAADLAVLKIEAQDLPTIPLGSSDELKLGQQVVAIGYALALEGGPTVTTGIVSALGRSIDATDPNCDVAVCENHVRTYSNVIQTDAAINPGNSGGPLLNLAGEVVGINSAGAGSAENIGFAIAINAAKPTINGAALNPSAPVAYLGVVTESVSEGLALQFDLPVTSGAYVLSVSPGGPAEKGGLETGDVIVGFDGEQVPNSDALGGMIRSLDPGDEVQVEVVGPSGERRTLSITLGVNPLPQS
jgi:serine protease Do